MDMQLRKSNDFRRSAPTLAGGFERTGRTQSVLRTGSSSFVKYDVPIMRGCTGRLGLCAFSEPCSETFPFPWAPGAEPKDDPRVQAISQAAKELVEQRDRWLNAEGLSDADKKKRTLTNLYNQRPTWLDLAHKRLDMAVFAAYGWKPDLSDEEILEKLLRLNLERSSIE